MTREEFAERWQHQHYPTMDCISPLQRKVLTHKVFTFASKFLLWQNYGNKGMLRKGNVFSNPSVSL